MAAVIFAGWLSRRFDILSSKDTSVFGSFVYRFALPALFFAEIARIDFGAIGISPILISHAPLVIIAIALVALKVSGILSKDLFVLIGLTVFFGSNAFFGVPFFESLYGQWGMDMAVTTGSILSIFGIFMCISLLEYATGNRIGPALILRVLKSPLIASIAAGLIFHFIRPAAEVVPKLVLPLGRTAPGVAVFMLGMFLHDRFSLTVVKKAVPLGGVRILVWPVVARFVIMAVSGVDGRVRSFLLLLSGIPAAISVAIFAERYNYKAEELTGMVILTSLGAFLTLGVLYFISLGLF
jgi:predicted permease